MARQVSLYCDVPLGRGQKRGRWGNPAPDLQPCRRIISVARDWHIGNYRTGANHPLPGQKGVVFSKVADYFLFLQVVTIVTLERRRSVPRIFRTSLGGQPSL